MQLVKGVNFPIRTARPGLMQNGTKEAPEIDQPGKEKKMKVLCKLNGEGQNVENTVSGFVKKCNFRLKVLE